MKEMAIITVLEIDHNNGQTCHKVNVILGFIVVVQHVEGVQLLYATVGLSDQSIGFSACNTIKRKHANAKTKRQSILLFVTKIVTRYYY